MAKFLNTSAANYYIEELIKNAKERLFLISPYLRLNERVREMLDDKNRLKIDVRIVYGKTELHPDEIRWLAGMSYIRTSFCKNLHAKCYLNESEAIITSLNLYEFSQINNNEMGVIFSRDEDGILYRDTYDEAQRLIRISEEIRLAAEQVIENSADKNDNVSEQNEKLTSSKIASKLNLKTAEFIERCVTLGYLEPIENGGHKITELGKNIGVEFIPKSRFGSYFLWPKDIIL